MIGVTTIRNSKTITLSGVGVKKEGPPCGHAGLITTKWENPRPDIKIATIDAVSLELGSVPVIPAITLGEATLAVEPAAKLAVTWGSLKNALD